MPLRNADRLDFPDSNPFCGRLSSITRFDRISGEPLKPIPPFHSMANRYFREMVSHSDFPCLGAKAVLAKGDYAMGAYSDMTSTAVAEGVCHDLLKFREMFSDDDGMFSFVAAFEWPELNEELKGASAYFTLLRNMRTADSANGFSWDPKVSRDVDDPHFAFSVAGHGYFVPLFYPAAYFPARRSDVSFVVFNAHDVFAGLRSRGLFAAFRDKIRQRQARIGIEVDPRLGDFGAVNQFDQHVLADPEKECQVGAIRDAILSKCPFGHE